MSSAQDIEIYVKGLAFDDLLVWLERCFEQVRILKKGAVVHDILVKTSEHDISLLVVENAVGKQWTSVWFKSPDTPWKDDCDCARALNRYSRYRVRANADFWSDGDDMDEWWQVIENGTESRVSWPNAG